MYIYICVYKNYVIQHDRFITNPSVSAVDVQN